MNMLKNLFKNRTWNFYMSVTVAILAIIADIVLIAVDRTDTGSLDRTFSLAAFIFILLGAAVQISTIFVGFALMPLLPVIFYAIGTGLHVYAGIPTMTDIFTHVNFYGGNQWAVVIFGVLFLIFTVASVLNCFFEDRKVITVAAE